MSISSDDSLGDLPLPYDISTAVSRALRINSTDGTTTPHEQDGCPEVACPSNSLTAFDTASYGTKCRPLIHRASYPTTSIYAYESITPHTFTPTELHHYSNPPIYDQFGMEASDAWNDSTVTVSICSSSESMLDTQNDMEQLDQFCNYIVSNSDEELPLESTTTAPAQVAPVYPTNSCPGSSYYHQYPVRIDSPPRKKLRSTSSYGDYHYPGCSSTESSPEKSINRLTQNLYWAMKLENVSLWRQFDQIGTEMVITKGGRYGIAIYCSSTHHYHILYFIHCYIYSIL